ncbi:hypothetical protein KIW84_061939 [Lathyrus oleraceus]|uniref:Uncharacterized protein n=1 Tax=Pisum sativum TaxID=3888 RepID=A0A9D4W5L2_PEA|nr:hypothetical protein KIW84_061939 [Pisum sativum]
MFVIVYFCPQAGKDLYEAIGGTQGICNLSPAILLSRPSAHTTVLMHWDTNPRSCTMYSCVRVLSVEGFPHSEPTLLCLKLSLTRDKSCEVLSSLSFHQLHLSPSMARIGLLPVQGNYVALILIPDEVRRQEMSRSLRAPVSLFCVVVCLEADAPRLPLPVFVCVRVSRATNALILLRPKEIRMHRMRHPSEHVSFPPVRTTLTLMSMLDRLSRPRIRCPAEFTLSVSFPSFGINNARWRLCGSSFPAGFSRNTTAGDSAGETREVDLCWSTCAWQCDVPQAGRGSSEGTLPLWDVCSDGDFVSDYWLIRVLFRSRIYGSISGRRRFDPGIDRRVPFISDPQVEFESTCSEDLAVIRSVDVPVMMMCQPVRIARLLRYPARSNKSKLMDPPNADILELKEMVRDLFSVVQGLALGQKAMSERLDKIEKWLIVEKVQGKDPSPEVTNPSDSVAKEPFGGGLLMKEVDSSGVPAKKERSKDRYHPYAAVIAPVGNPLVPPQQLPPQQKAPRARSQVKKKKEERQFEEPPVTYTLLFRRLRDLGLVRPRILIPVAQQKSPAHYDENARCEFHSEAPRHNIEGCRAFKHVVQDMVDSKTISLAQIMDGDVNPVPRQGPVKVKMVKKVKKGMEVIEEDQLKVPMAVVPKPLVQDGAFPVVDDCCAAIAIEGCVGMKDTTQKMVEMDSEKVETPSQAIETIKVENAVVIGKEKTLSISSYKQALEVVKNKEARGWGRIIDIVVKADMFGIGYPDQESSRPNRGHRPPYIFVSAGMLNSDHACSVSEEIDRDRELELWIKSCVPGNWKASKSITVTHPEV